VFLPLNLVPVKGVFAVAAIFLAKPHHVEVFCHPRNLTKQKHTLIFKMRMWHITFVVLIFK